MQELIFKQEFKWLLRLFSSSIEKDYKEFILVENPLETKIKFFNIKETDKEQIIKNLKDYLLLFSLKIKDLHLEN